jgi:hypothetical protein
MPRGGWWLLGLFDKSLERARERSACAGAGQLQGTGGVRWRVPGGDAVGELSVKPWSAQMR